jgi:hypothetical protein
MHSPQRQLTYSLDLASDRPSEAVERLLDDQSAASAHTRSAISSGVRRITRGFALGFLSPSPLGQVDCQKRRKAGRMFSPWAITLPSCVSTSRRERKPPHSLGGVTSAGGLAAVPDQYFPSLRTLRELRDDLLRVTVGWIGRIQQVKRLKDRCRTLVICHLRLDIFRMSPWLLEIGPADAAFWRRELIVLRNRSSPSTLQSRPPAQQNATRRPWPHGTLKIPCP